MLRQLFLISTLLSLGFLLVACQKENSQLAEVPVPTGTPQYTVTPDLNKPGS